MLRDSEDLKWSQQPERPATPMATKHWRIHRPLPPHKPAKATLKTLSRNELLPKRTKFNLITRKSDVTRESKLDSKDEQEDEEEEGSGRPSCVQALDLGPTVHVSGLRAGADVVVGTLLGDADSPLLHRQECVHCIRRSCQEAKYLQETGTVGPQAHQQSTRCLSRTRARVPSPAESLAKSVVM